MTKDTIEYMEINDKIYSELGLDWECYSCFTDEIDGVPFIFFVKNELADNAWDNDGSMVVGVEL